MELSIAFSPCPNDTFIFDALVHHKIDTEGIQFRVVLEDVETLNEQAIQNTYDITKVSYGAYPALANDYKILNSGSALGRGVGPLLIKKQGDERESMNQLAVALPGKNTTAHFLFSHAYPEVRNKLYMRYDAIAPFVLAEKGWGVIIHENRFTYEQSGLVKMVDLGNYWEETTGLPIPLGGIVVSRKLDDAMQKKIDRLILKSIEHAYEQYPKLTDFIKCHAQEMSEEVMRSHIELYVNDFSRNLGEEGKAAIIQMLNIWGLDMRTDLFV